MSNDRTSLISDKTRLVSALVALGGGIGSANAIELGDIQVQSHLGEPLRASIAYALAPNEELANYCVSASAVASGFPTVGNTTVAVRDGVITLSGTSAVREPMISARITINCPYTPNLTREYLMFIDPAGMQAQQENTSVEPRVAANPVAAPLPESRQRPVARAASIQQGEQYRVRAGESLSEIVQRIENRKLGLWPAVNAVFDANPDAFVNGDPNRLKAGSLLVIPSLVGGELSAPQATPAVAATVSATPSIEPATNIAESVAEPTNLSDLETVNAAADPVEAVRTPLEETNPYVAANQELIVQEASIDSPEQAPTFAAPASPNTSTATIVTPAADSTSFPPALLWSIGGLGLIAALLLFRRRFRDDNYDDTPQSKYVDDALDNSPTETVEVRSADYGLSDESPTDRNLALDAAIVVNHDLSDGIDVDFTEAFDGRAELDLDLDMADEEAAAKDRTDIIPPPQIEGSSILQEEVLPDDDEYDMSMIVDLTKVPDPTDVTARDLQAVEVSADDEYTLNTQTDLEILEQDYQDELSATQALNLEIERAAQQLVEQLSDDDDETANIQVGDISQISVASDAVALNETSADTQKAPLLADDDDTDTNVHLGEDDETTIMNRDEDTARLGVNEDTAKLRHTAVADDETVEVMTSDGDHTVEIITREDDDKTVEMEIEGGRVNTRNG